MIFLGFQMICYSVSKLSDGISAHGTFGTGPVVKTLPVAFQPFLGPPGLLSGSCLGSLVLCESALSRGLQTVKIWTCRPAQSPAYLAAAKACRVGGGRGGPRVTHQIYGNLTTIIRQGKAGGGDPIR